MEDVYVVSAVRTPIGRFGGSLTDVSAVDLAAHVMRASLERSNVAGKAVDLYVMGNVLRHGQGQLVPRQAALRAGIPVEVDGYAVDMVCSSGMMSFINAATTIKVGDGDLVLAGGVESMSRTGFLLSHKARWGYKFLMGSPEQVTDVLLHDGLTDPTNGQSMGEETERLIEEQNISRAELDEVAYLSHSRATAATENGQFAAEIIPLEIKQRRKTVLFEKDEGIRPETTRDSLAKLRPAFQEDGTLTAGNSSQISDGAAALMLASGKAVDEHNLKPIAKVLGHTISAGEPWRFAEAPIPTVQKLLRKLNLTANEIDLYENNEAFAVNNVLLQRALGVGYDKINLYGGAIALGHPIGCSGARIIVTLLNALQQTGGKRGIASLCHGIGGGTAIAVEMV